MAFAVRDRRLPRVEDEVRLLASSPRRLLTSSELNYDDIATTARYKSPHSVYSGPSFYTPTHNTPTTPHTSSASHSKSLASQRHRTQIPHRFPTIEVDDDT